MKFVLLLVKRVIKADSLILLLWRGGIAILVLVISPLLCLVSQTDASETDPSPMVLIKGGSYAPLFKADPKVKETTVEAFYLDTLPVTRREFAAFIERYPKWNRDNVASIFANSEYLRGWTVERANNAPITFVSWFAAKAYCRSQGKRLPSVAEWEYAALASETQADGRTDKEFMGKVIEWYSQASPETLPEVGQGKANYWGVYDLHGLVFEWVSDFNSALVTGESRSDSGLDRNLFCGAGAQGATESEKINYPAFMRYAFRNSLEGSYSVHNLGFRCARDVENK